MEITVQPTIIREGDKDLALKYLSQGLSVLRQLDELMEFNRLEQCQIRRVPHPGIEIHCSRIYGAGTITIKANQKMFDAKVVNITECFANSSCALAFIVSVAGVIVKGPDDPLTIDHDIDPICPPTVIDVNHLPSAYYCTKTIRYNVAVCDGKGDYLLFENVPSSDFTPRCPGNKVIVMLNRTTNLPSSLRSAAATNPWAKRPFTNRASKLTGARVTILPFRVALPKYETFDD